MLAWMIEALKDDHELTLLAASPPDFAHANRVFGTSIAEGDIEIRLVPSLETRLERSIPRLARLPMFRRCLVMALARGISDRYDLVVATDNESDVGTRAMQYVHFPGQLFWHPDPRERWRQATHWVYGRVLERLTGFSRTRMQRTLTLVNSAWTGSLVRKACGVTPRVLTPPTATAGSTVPWRDREPAFACVGRIAPDKRLLEVIDIVRRVRRRHPDIRLRLFGFGGHTAYVDRIAAIAGRERDWLTLQLDLSRVDLTEQLAQCRFGIHGMPFEHYGMGVAELVQAGAIVFAPNRGGPVEILGGNRSLLFEGPNDAVEKISRVLENPDLEAHLRKDLSVYASRLTPQHFVREFRELVRSRRGDDLGGGS